MKVFFSMLYVLLKKEYPLIDLSISQKPLQVNSARIYKGSLEPGFIYVVPHVVNFRIPTVSDEYVLIFLETDALGLKFPTGTAAVLLGSCHDALDALNSIIELFLNLERWHTQLYQYDLNNSTPGDMLQLLYTLLPQRLVYDDENSKHIYEYPTYKDTVSDDTIKYASKESASPDNPEYASFDQFLATNHYEIVYAINDLPFVQVMQNNIVGNIIITRQIFNNQKLLGKINLRYEENTPSNYTLMDGYCRLVDLFSENFELKLIASSKGSVSAGTDALHNAIYNLIFSQNPQTSRNVLGYLSELGWAQSNSYLLCSIVIDSQSVFIEISGYLCGFFEKILENCIAVREKGQIILLLNTTVMGRNPTDEIVKYLTRLRNEHNRFLCYASFSSSFNNILLTPGYYMQCDYLLKHRKIWRTNEWVFHYKNHSMDFIAAHLTAHFSVEYICHPGVMALYQYDKDHNTELSNTLYYYMKFHLNASESAAAIPIHRTTFNKRLEKITSIYPFNFYSVDECLHILLSLKLLFGTSQSPL